MTFCSEDSTLQITTGTEEGKKSFFFQLFKESLVLVTDAQVLPEQQRENKLWHLKKEQRSQQTLKELLCVAATLDMETQPTCP